MSTSRKLRVKLAKHRRSARKAARKEPELEPAESSMAETQASTERGTVTARSALTGTQFVSFCHWLSGQKLFAGLSLFTCTFQSLRRAVGHTETDDAWNAWATETLLGSRHSSVCHWLEGPQAHPLPEQLPRPEESVHCEQACGGPAGAVDRPTACGGLHQVS